MNLTPPPPNDTVESTDNIVGINPGIDKELEILRVHNARKWPCSGIHKNVLVDAVSRTVTCRTCGFVIDPFEYMHDWAKEGDRRMRGLEVLKVKSRILNAEVATLIKRLESIRGKLKRSGHPQPDVERAAFHQNMSNAETSQYVRLGTDQ